MMRHCLYLPLVVVLFALSACETPQVFSRGNPQIVATQDPVSARLADAAERASNALETLAAVEYARSPAVAVSPVADAPAELRRAVSFKWVGPVETLTKSLADRASYDFALLGNPPPVPLVISLNVENKPIIDVLRDIGLQLGQRADVKVDAQLRRVEIQFAPNSAGAINAQGF